MPIHPCSPSALPMAGGRRAAWWNSPPLYCLAMSSLAVACLALVCLLSPGTARAGTAAQWSCNGGGAAPLDQCQPSGHCGVLSEVSNGAILDLGLPHRPRRGR